MKKCVLIAALILPTGMAAASRAETPWFDKARVGMEIEPTGAQFGYCDDDFRYCIQAGGRHFKCS